MQASSICRAHLYPFSWISERIPQAPSTTPITQFQRTIPFLPQSHPNPHLHPLPTVIPNPPPSKMHDIKPSSPPSSPPFSLSPTPPPNLTNPPTRPEIDDRIPKPLQRKHNRRADIQRERRTGRVSQAVDAIDGRRDPGYEDGDGEEEGAADVGPFDLVGWGGAFGEGGCRGCGGGGGGGAGGLVGRWGGGDVGGWDGWEADGLWVGC